jgi:K+-transporting ATPase KdpF subunit
MPLRQRRVRWRQEGVKDRQGAINQGPRPDRVTLTDSVIENAIAAVLGLALLAYLVYALVRPEKF